MGEVKMIGGKAAGLGNAGRVARVPPFGAVPATAFSEMLNHHNMTALYSSLWAESPSDPDWADVADDVRSAIVEALYTFPIPPAALLAIDAAYASATAHESNQGLIARSSADVEDSQLSSWAGMFRSDFGIQSLHDATNAVRRVWASVVEASKYVISAPSLAPRMAVVLQTAVEARLSGVIIGGPTEDECLIEATLGLAGPLVEGRTSPERWRVNGRKFEKSQAWQPNPVRVLDVVARQPGYSTTFKLSADDPITVRFELSRRPGTWDGLALRSSVNLLSEDEVSDLRLLFAQLRRSWGQNIDVEWVLDIQERLYCVQCRPATAVTFNAERAEMRPSVLATGVPVTGGRGHGTATFGEPLSGKPFVLLRKFLGPFDAPAMMNAAAVLVEEGGILSHGAILARELGVPCLIGLRPTPPPIEESDFIKVDATAGTVERGLPGQRASDESAPASNVESSSLEWCCDPPAQAYGRPTVALLMSDSMVSRLPQDIHSTLQLLSVTPGVVGQVSVLPDVRTRKRHGFLSGVAFRSVRLHPTAIGDMGDGMLLAEVHGVSVGEIRASLAQFASVLAESLMSPDDDLPQLDELLSDGLNAYTECNLDVDDLFHPEAAYVDPTGIPQDLRDYLSATMSTRDRIAGHFLDFLEPENGDRAPMLLLHTGLDTATKAFNSWITRKGIEASAAEGIDLPASSIGHMFGVDPGSRVGGRLVTASLAMVHAGYVRRQVIASRVAVAVKKWFGRRASVRMISNYAHSCLKSDGDALLYQQGVQVVAGSAQGARLAISGGPWGPTFVVSPECLGTRILLPHGRSWLPEETLSPYLATLGTVGRLDESEYPPAMMAAQTESCLRETGRLTKLASADRYSTIFALRGGKRTTFRTLTGKG